MPQLRKDPVTGRWVLLHRDRAREVEELIIEPSPEEGENFCMFCEGHEDETPQEIFAARKEGGAANGPGWSARVVPHRIGALHVEGEINREGVGMFDKMNGIGAHEVLVETPVHGLDMADMKVEAIAEILKIYRDRIEEIQRDVRLKSVLVFKNREKKKPGRNRHSVSQILALPMIPHSMEAEYHRSSAYFDYKQRCLFCDIITDELRMNERVVLESDWFFVYAPYAASHPFELCLLPKQHQADYCMMQQQEALLECAKTLKTVYQLLKITLLDPSYSFILHTVPNPAAKPERWPNIENHYHWHMEIVPRVRNETGFERGTGFHLNPVAPESVARFLRERAAMCAEG